MPRGPLPFRLSAAQRAYLVEQGVTSETTWASFRLGCASADEQRRFGLVGRRALNPTAGISIPTWDLCDPATTVGVVRLNPSQNKHGFVTTPAGIAGPMTLATGKRIVLTDTPLVALRLHQAGVVDVALCEDPAVLPSMAVTLRKRTIIIASLRHAGLNAMQKALRAAGIRDAQRVQLRPSLSRLSRADLDTLGADLSSLLPSSAGITPEIIAEVMALAQSYAGKEIGYRDIDRQFRRLRLDPALARMYRMGLLPRWRALARRRMSPGARDCIISERLQLAAIVPAFDADGQVVDMMVIPHRRSPRPTLWPSPRGCIAPPGSIDGDEVVALDLAAWDRLNAVLERANDRAVWIVRGPADAGQNAAALVRAGVRFCRLLSDEPAPFVARLRGAGIRIDLMTELMRAVPVSDPEPPLL